MEKFERPLQLRWSDLDPNFHVRHSVYYDFAAQLRTEFLISQGLTPMIMQQENFGPILFREEALFRKELHFGDELTINLFATKLKRDSSRFSFRHQIMRGEEVCAVVNIDGAWINTIKRKLTAPPAIGREVMEALPKAEDFEWQD